MKIILVENIENVGKAGQVMTVKDGFARNYLLPKKYAIIANDNNLKKIEKIEADAKVKAEKKNAELRLLAEKIGTLQADFIRRAEDDGKLFGSVSDVDLVKFLSENDINVTKTNIVLDKHIKNTGEYQVKVSFTNDINATLKVNVTPGN